MRLIFRKYVNGAHIAQRIHWTDFIRVKYAKTTTLNHGRSGHTNG